MTSNDRPTEAYVWIWLPNATEPVVAGLLSADGDDFVFNYGRSYLDRTNSIPLYEPELPLKAGIQYPLPGLRMPNCIRDASPDAWGRRVIVNRYFGTKGDAINVDQVDELTYLLESGSDRIGALDFQSSATEYVAREPREASFEELMDAAFWDGSQLTLTPAYDICPQRRAGNEASQAMLITGNNRMSRLEVCLQAAKNFQLSIEDADAIIESHVETIQQSWPDICDEAQLGAVDQNVMWRRQILNPYVFEGLPRRFATLGS